MILSELAKFSTTQTASRGLRQLSFLLTGIGAGLHINWLVWSEIGRCSIFKCIQSIALTVWPKNVILFSLITLRQFTRRHNSMARVTGHVLGINIIIIQSISEDWQSLYIYSQIPLDLYAFFLFIFILWGGTRSLRMPTLRPASQAGPMRNAREGTSVVLRDTIRRT